MEIGLFTSSFYNLTWEELCRMASETGIKVLEVGAGASNGKVHCNPAELLKDDRALEKFNNTANKYNIKIGSLVCMGNQLHPKNNQDRIDLENAVDLAIKLDVKVVSSFAGCPGAAEDALYPNWVGLAYPPEFSKFLEWQWEKRIIPFWKKMVKKAKKGGVKFGFEMHPGDSVYNTSTLLKLREKVGAEEIGCCFDPAHLFWQGIDPIESIKHLEGIIVGAHAQDCEVNKKVAVLDGVLDTKDYGDIKNRAWNLKLVGYGHGEDFWKKLVSALRIAGYDGALSIEHQDALVSMREGIKKAVDFLEKIIFYEKPDEIKY